MDRNKEEGEDHPKEEEVLDKMKAWLIANRKDQNKKSTNEKDGMPRTSKAVKEAKMVKSTDVDKPTTS